MNELKQPEDNFNMQAWYRSLFSVFLSITIILAGSPIQLFLHAKAESEVSDTAGAPPQAISESEQEAELIAQKDTEAEKQKKELDERIEAQSAEQEYLKSIEELYNAFGTEEYREAHLDTFLLTRQTIVDDRKEKLKSVVEQLKLDDYLDRVEDIKREIEDYKEALSRIDEKIVNNNILVAQTKKSLADALVERADTQKSDLEKIANKNGVQSQIYLDAKEQLTETETALFDIRTNKVDSALSEKQLKEYNLIREDILSRIEFSQLELDDLKERHPQDNDRLKINLMIDEELQPRHYYGRKMRLHLASEGKTLQVIKQEDFTESLSPAFNKAGDEYSSVENVHFAISDSKNNIMHEFLNPIRSVTFFGKYLVFIESNPDSDTDDFLNLRFIDLTFSKVNIGNAKLPVFTLPLKVETYDRSLNHENGYLVIGGQKLGYHQFELISKVSQALFNENVALVDPDSYESSKPLLDEIFELFNLSMKAMDKSFQEQMDQAIAATPYLQKTINNMQKIKAVDTAQSLTTIKKALEDGLLTNEEFNQIKSALNSNDSMLETNTALANGRRFMTRMNMLTEYLMRPRPEGSTKLFNALVMLAATKDNETRGRVLKLTKEGFIPYAKTLIRPITKPFEYRLVRYGAYAGAALLASKYITTDHSLNLFKSFDLISATGQHFMGYLEHINYGKAYVELSKDAFLTTTSGLNPFYLFETYLGDGKWTKFLYGMGQVLLVPLTIYGVIHFTTNLYKTRKQTIKIQNTSANDIEFLNEFELQYLSDRKLSSFLNAATTNFSNRYSKKIQSWLKATEKDKEDYWKNAADAETRSSGSRDVSEITEYQVKLLNDHIDRLKKGRTGIAAVERDIKNGKYGSQGAVSSLIGNITGISKINNFSNFITKHFKKSASELNVSESSIFGSLKQAFLSRSSITTAFRGSALFWNPLFMTRSYFWSPHKYILFIMYPNFFSAAVRSNPGKQHFPSKYNGGLNSWLNNIKRAVMSGKTTSKNLQTTQISPAEIIKQTRYFEDEIVKLEIAAMNIAKTKAQMALVKNIRDPKRLMMLFDSAQRPLQEGQMYSDVSTGIRDLNDKKLKNLTTKERTFYQAFFTRTFDLIMQKSILELTNFDSTEADPSVFAQEFKTRMQKEGMNLNPDHLSPQNIKALTNDAEAMIDFDEVEDWSRNTATKLSQFYSRFEIRLRHKALQSMHPQNGQVKRYLKVEDKVDDPRAMDRATRSQISTLVTGIPIGIATTLIMYAGVQSGILMPFDPSQMDSETHTNYMSNYLFYSGFIPGFVLSLLAQTWMKLQTDDRIDQKGGFNQSLISYKDSKRGFWRFYLKNVFKNPANKWRDNHIHQLKLITSNIPAAAVTIIASNIYGMGRIDVETFLASYFIIYATFLTGWNTKMDQAFELASSWVSSKIPLSVRSHPKAQKYINASLQKRRMYFEFFDNIYDYFVTTNLAGSMLVLKDNVKYGTRAFIRMVFGGETPTTLIVKGAEAMGEALKNIPGISKIKDGIIYTFSNNYEAFERFPDKLPKVQGIPQVGENPNLPQNTVAEFIGKSLGFISTWGAMLVSPYIVTDYLQKRRERKLQKQGEEIEKRRNTLSRLSADGLRNKLPSEEEINKMAKQVINQFSQENALSKFLGDLETNFKNHPMAKSVGADLNFKQSIKELYLKDQTLLEKLISDGIMLQIPKSDPKYAVMIEVLKKPEVMAAITFAYKNYALKNEQQRSNSVDPRIITPHVYAEQNSCAEFLKAN